MFAVLGDNGQKRIAFTNPEVFGAVYMWWSVTYRAIRQVLAPQKRGRKVDPQAAALERLRQENERLKARLEQAETIIDVQNKLVTLFGTEASPTSSDEER